MTVRRGPFVPIKLGSLTIHSVYDYTAIELCEHFDFCRSLIITGSPAQFQLACRDMARISTDFVARKTIPNIRDRVWGFA